MFVFPIELRNHFKKTYFRFFIFSSLLLKKKSFVDVAIHSARFVNIVTTFSLCFHIVALFQFKVKEIVYMYIINLL